VVKVFSSVQPSQDDKVSEVREALTQKILMNANDIIDAAIEQAKKGHYSITRLLFGIAGLYPAPRGASDATDRSLADLLCKELGLPEPDNDEAQPAPPPDPAHSLK
jgi:hypothetical protein